MMRYFFGILVILAVFVLPQAYASCIVNQDWPDAPCLDGIIDGSYEQHEVNKWAEYYQYKGTPFMEQKRAEMEQAIDEETIKEWVAESDQNRNVYSYYYFSGRAPDIGIYHAQFEEFMINESSTIHDPYTDDERYYMASQKIPLGGLGINPEFTGIIIGVGVAIGAGIAIGLLIFWRRKK